MFQSQYSLLEDHRCSKMLLPSKAIAVLHKHKDEVWIVRFSNSGKKLATVSKDNLICLWSLNYDNIQSSATKNLGKLKVKCTHEIKGHSKETLALSWTNQDDRYIVTCGKDHMVRMWDTKSGRMRLEIDRHCEAVQNVFFTQDD
mmetsp:Transcript_7506/g.5701  ORF Transcript_7506/g.5701 Transcript_7506/m.5701 type:complete len:144 (+) Transcript_7506:669-1100(+)|eukprot:CAMPEP_0202968386 /NCGR_PEP_ID=MMETSP1396-20130829/13651_1 /ASSEMBLY_ACC=CAM_ASM_000872 /TAXON_ID= /ORGANISM="Pseudokeronopsis sp., Strain Brazil" /LENGTH=143 /DNA_ID=CAMNT_0049694629 /DNA_START=594 /DNA_END=1025 /DNA_ORIENTATION=+